MREVGTIDLEAVTGGTTKQDQALELALTKLQSDIKDLARPQSTSQQLLPLMMMAVASRR